MLMKLRCPQCRKDVGVEPKPGRETVVCPACKALISLSEGTAAQGGTEAAAAPDEVEQPAGPSFITFQCPNCAKPTGFPAALRGKPATCPGCYVQIMVPEASGQPSFLVGGVSAPPEPGPAAGEAADAASDSPAARPAARGTGRQAKVPPEARPAPRGSGHHVKVPPEARPAARGAGRQEGVLLADRARKPQAAGPLLTTGTPLFQGPLAPRPKSSKLVLVVAAGVLVLLLLVGGVFHFVRRANREPSAASGARAPAAATSPAPGPPDAKPEGAGKTSPTSPTSAGKPAEGEKTATVAKGEEKPAGQSVLDNWAENFAKDTPAAPAPAVAEPTRPQVRTPSPASKESLADLPASGTRNDSKARSDEEDEVARKPAEKPAEKPASSAQTPPPAPEASPPEPVREPQPQLASQECAAIDRALAGKDEQGAVQHINALGEANAPAAVSYLLKISRTASAAAFEAIRKALAALNHPTALEALLSTYKLSGDQATWSVRILLLDTFAARESPQAIEAFRRAMQDTHSKVRLAMIRAVARGRLRVADRVPLLVGALAATERFQDFGTPHWEARRALAACTGYDWPRARDWQNFLAKAGKNWLEKKGDQTDASVTEGYSYYELPVTSRRLVFVIDTSGSMQDFDYIQYADRPQYVQPVECDIPRPNNPPPPDGISVEGEGVSGTDRSTGGNVKVTKTKEYLEWEKKYQKEWDEWERKYQEWLRKHPEVEKTQREYHEKYREWQKKHPEARMNRLERAKAELSRLIEKLPADACFNILAFNSKLDSYKPTLVQAVPVEKAGALAFVKRLSPGGNTVTDQALELAFEADAQADTIYLLSDGEPSHDGIARLPIEPILARVRDLNRYHRIIIHALLVGREGHAFMKALAEENGGVFEDITQKVPNVKPAK